MALGISGSRRHSRTTGYFCYSGQFLSRRQISSLNIYLVPATIREPCRRWWCRNGRGQEEAERPTRLEVGGSGGPSPHRSWEVLVEVTLSPGGRAQARMHICREAHTPEESHPSRQRSRTCVFLCSVYASSAILFIQGLLFLPKLLPWPCISRVSGRGLLLPEAGEGTRVVLSAAAVLCPAQLASAGTQTSLLSEGVKGDVGGNGNAAWPRSLRTRCPHAKGGQE